MASTVHPGGVIYGIDAPELNDENVFNAKYVIEVKQLDANPADEEFGAIINLYIQYDQFNESGVMESVKQYYGTIDQLFVAD